MHPKRTACTASGSTLRLLVASSSLAFLLAAPVALHATTFIPPTNYAELARASDAVVLAHAQRTTHSRRGAQIWGETLFDVIETVRGPLAVGASVAVSTPGGSVVGATGEREAWRVIGSPEYREGEVYLLALQSVNEGARWIPTMLDYALYREVLAPTGRTVLVPEGELRQVDGFPRPDGRSVEPLEPVLAREFLTHLRSVLENGREWDASGLATDFDSRAQDAEGRGADGAVAAIPGVCNFLTSGGAPFRWRAFDTGDSATIFSDDVGDPTLTGNGFPLVQDSMDHWMDITGLSLNLRYGGPRPVDPPCSSSDSVANFILFNDPCSDIGDLEGCGGVLAFGGPRSSGTHNFDGRTWLTANTWIVVVNNGIGCLGSANFRVMMAHELGHGLGFGHVEDNGALMFASCCRNINSTDRTCSRYAYPPIDPANERPSADAGGSRTLLLSGNRALLRGSVDDDGLPAPSNLETLWTQLSGPASVVFSDAEALESDVTFPASGTYLLALEVDDGQLIHIDSFTVEVEVFAGSTARLSFQQGVAGYSGTQDTVLLEGEPTQNSGDAPSLEVDADSPADSGLTLQSLLRFDAIFGDGPGQIPPGSDIFQAWLEVRTTNFGNGARLHRLTADWDEASSWSDFGSNGIVAGSEALSRADAETAGSIEMVRIDVTESLRAWSLDPSSNRGWAFLPSGDDGWDFDSSEGDTPPQLTVEYPVFERQRLVAVGEEWHWFRGSTNPGAEWSTPGFDTSRWERGATGIGYGDGDDATVVSGMQNSFLTIYARRDFAVEDPARFGRLSLRIDYDDGFVAYLNGVEVARSSNLGAPGSPVSRNDAASASHEAGTPEEFPVDAGLLRAGDNVLAVEVHNSSLGSGDLSLIPELVADVVLIPGDAVWRYLPGSEPLPPGWMGIPFDDSAWSSGATSIGYGDGDDLTELADMRGRYVSVFCRRAFEITCVESVDELDLTLIYDDGVVAWINGIEVTRANVGPGPIGRATEASSSGEATLRQLSIPRSRLREGTNVLAVSVHNSDIDSSDLSFSAILVPSFLDAEDLCDTSGEPRFRRGDSVPDGVLDLSDAVRVLLVLFAGGEALDCPDAADFDDDGQLQITDPVALLGYLFQGAAAPMPPAPGCGVDPTEDELGLCDVGGC